MENSAVGGWKDICDNYNDLRKSSIFKVPHHGSVTAYYESVWTTLLDKPIALITRYNNSHLPRPEILQKVVNHSLRTFVVGPKARRDKKLMRMDEKAGGMIKEASIIDDRYGYVRLYKKSGVSNWFEETNGAVICYKKGDDVPGRPWTEGGKADRFRAYARARYAVKA